jgi:hypothetical protein
MIMTWENFCAQFEHDLLLERGVKIFKRVPQPAVFEEAVGVHYGVTRDDGTEAHAFIPAAAMHAEMVEAWARLLIGRLDEHARILAMQNLQGWGGIKLGEGTDAQ